MKTIIAGSRHITDVDMVVDVILKSGIDITQVVCGCANGVDAIGAAWAEDNGIPVIEFPALWDLYGKSAGYKRNVEMAHYSDSLIAIWDGRSTGTKHMIDTALKHGLHVCLQIV